MTTDTRRQLAAVLGMLGSDYDAEVAVAARTAERIRKQTGQTWHQVIKPPTSLRAIAPPVSIRQQIMLCWNHRDRLTEWETGFIWSLMSCGGCLR
jgi:hypothetical protein